MIEVLKAFLYALAFSSIAILIAPWCYAIYLAIEKEKSKRKKRKKNSGILPQIKNLLVYIYTNFGSKQAEKLKEEVNEFLDAVECGDRVNQSEELADILVVLMQYIYFYEIDTKAVEKTFYEKINRTIARIEKGYYDN